MNRSFPPSFQRPVQARIDAPGIALEHLAGIVPGQVQRVDIAFGVVEIMAGRGVDAPHRADHFRPEQDILVLDDVRQQVDARLVIDAGVEEDVVHQMGRQVGLLQHVGQTAIAAPMIGHRAAAMRDDELEGREIPEQVALQQLHEGDGVGGDILVKRRVAHGRRRDEAIRRL